VTINCLKSEEFILVEISDNGPGIPDESLELVFNRFYRLPSQQKNHPPGAGLGLYICRQIIEAHNGRISAEPALGNGTTIKIFLQIINSTEE